MASWSSIAFVSSLGLALGGCRGKPVPVYGAVPRFELTAQTGRPFDSDSLKGHVWIADFVFTNCTGPCPRMTSQMKKVGDALPNARLVSFTIDPARDTPAVLQAYAEKFHADPARWTFLTGPRLSLHNLSRYVFLLGDVDASLEHSTRFVLVDRNSRIRGFYLSSEPDGIEHLLRDARSVLKETT